MKYIIALTTTPNKKVAQKICRTLVKKSLVACSQIIGPIESHYIWQNNIEESKEFLCLIKTKAKHYKIIEKTIKLLHPYQIPEIIAFNVINGFEPYLNWINDQTL